MKLESWGVSVACLETTWIFLFTKTLTSATVRITTHDILTVLCLEIDDGTITRLYTQQ